MSKKKIDSKSIEALDHNVSLDDVIKNASNKVYDSSSNGIFPSFEKAYDLIDTAIAVPNRQPKFDNIRRI